MCELRPRTHLAWHSGCRTSLSKLWPCAAPGEGSLMVTGNGCVSCAVTSAGRTSWWGSLDPSWELWTLLFLQFEPFTPFLYGVSLLSVCLCSVIVWFLPAFFSFPSHPLSQGGLWSFVRVGLMPDPKGEPRRTSVIVGYWAKIRTG